MKVLQIIPRLISGGAERSALDVAIRLKDKGHEAFIMSEGGRMTQEIERKGVTHISMPVGSKSLYRIYRNKIDIMNIIKKYNIDLVHARSRAPAWSAYYAAKNMGVKFVTTYHGLYSEGNLFKKKYNQIMMRGKAVISVSDFMTEQLTDRYPKYAHKLKTIYRGIDLKYYVPELITRQRIEQLIKSWSLTDDLRHIILLPGRITRIKGHFLLIDAVKQLLKERQDFVCVCPGDVQEGKESYFKALKQAVYKEQLQNVILFPGGCIDMPAAYAISYIVIAPTTKPETFGRIPIEAQMMGKPVVASGHGGFCETIQDNQTGFLFTPNDSISLAEKITLALNLSEDERKKIAHLGKQNVMQTYSVERMCDNTIDLYTQLLKAS